MRQNSCWGSWEKAILFHFEEESLKHKNFTSSLRCQGVPLLSILMTRQKISLSSCSFLGLPRQLSLSSQFKTIKNRNNNILLQHHESSRWLSQHHLLWPGWQQLPKAREFGNDTNPCSNSSLSSNRQDRTGTGYYNGRAVGNGDSTSAHFNGYVTKIKRFFSFLGDLCLKTANRDTELKYWGPVGPFWWALLLHLTRSFQPLLGESPAPATSEDHFHG